MGQPICGCFRMGHSISSIPTSSCSTCRRISAGSTSKNSCGCWRRAEPGEYVMELDLVQEAVAWFEDRGSMVTKVAVKVGEAATAIASGAVQQEGPEDAGPADVVAMESTAMEMHCLPRRTVQQVV